MTYAEALKIASQKLADMRGGDSTAWKCEEELNTKRQPKKFAKGFGRVRQLAGLPHGRGSSK